MGWQPEDLTPQIDGVTSTFETFFYRRLSSLMVFRNGERVDGSLFTEPDSKHIATTFTPTPGDSLFTFYFTDQTFDGRVVGFPEEPGPATEIPQGLLDIIEALEGRVDIVEDQIEDLTNELRWRDVKNSVNVATTNDLGGTYDATGGTSGRGKFTGMPSIVNGYIVAVGTRVLVKDQISGDENGIWEVKIPGTGSNGEWERAADFDEDLEVSTGAFTVVVGGSVNPGTGWFLSTPDPIIVGGASGTAMTWQTFTAGGGGGGASLEYENRVCDAGVQVRDLVYVRTDGILDRAAGDDASTNPAIGFVASKLDATHCNVQHAGAIGGFSGLASGDQVWMGRTVGTLTQDPDADLSTTDDVIQPVGIALSPSEIAVIIDLSLIKFPSF